MARWTIEDYKGAGRVSSIVSTGVWIWRADNSVFSKLPNNDLKLNYGDGTGVNVHFKGFEESVPRHTIREELMSSCTIWNPQEATGSKMADLEDKGWVSSLVIFGAIS
jgi:glucose-6-phosphate 1-epimerase